MQKRLVLPTGLADQIAEHARAALPHEACGLIAGVDGRATEIYPGRNVSAKPEVAYELDTETLARQIDIEDRGLELVGIYHSHPAGPPVPSDTDVTLAYYPGAVYVICSFLPDGTPSLRAFSITGRSVTEVAIISA